MESASPSNLLGLMNQLQSLESSFISVLMEAALKLGAITDTSVFLLIETSDGRRISGKRQLCEAYLQGALTPTGSDLLFEVDPSIVALRPLPTTTQATSHLNQPVELRDLSSGGIAGDRPLNSLQQPSSPTPTHFSADSNRASSSPIMTSRLNGSVVAGDSSSLLSSRKRSASNNTAAAFPNKQPRNKNHPLPPPFIHANQQHISMQQQPPVDDVVKVEPDDEFKLDTFNPEFVSGQPSLNSTASAAVLQEKNNDDSDDVAVIEERSMTDIACVNATTTRAVATGTDNCGAFSSGVSTVASLLEEDSCSDLTQIYVANVPFPLPEDFIKKIEALQSMKTPSVFDKLSIEHRLFTSCVYQLGSVLAKQAVANPATYFHPTQFEDFFNHHVTWWLSSFPYLAKCESEGMRVDTGKGGMAIGAFVRHRARNAFRKGCVNWANKAGLMA